MDGKVDFLILDSPVSSMEWMAGQQMNGMEVGLPLPYLMFCGNTVNKWQLGFGYEDADVAEAMKETTIPLLVINSRQESVTPYFMAGIFMNLFQLKKKKCGPWKTADTLKFGSVTTRNAAQN